MNYNKNAFGKAAEKNKSISVSFSIQYYWNFMQLKKIVEENIFQKSKYIYWINTWSCFARSQFYVSQTVSIQFNSTSNNLKGENCLPQNIRSVQLKLLVLKQNLQSSPSWEWTPIEWTIHEFQQLIFLGHQTERNWPACLTQTTGELNYYCTQLKISSWSSK